MFVTVALEKFGFELVSPSEALCDVSNDKIGNFE